MRWRIPWIACQINPVENRVQEQRMFMCTARKSGTRKICFPQHTGHHLLSISSTDRKGRMSKKYLARALTYQGMCRMNLFPSNNRSAQCICTRLVATILSNMHSTFLFTFVSKCTNIPCPRISCSQMPGQKDTRISSKTACQCNRRRIRSLCAAPFIIPR